MSLPKMTSRGNEPLSVFPINGKYVLAVYKGTLSVKHIFSPHNLYQT